ncbi:MAG TPA: hypothetical protein VEK79_09590 [Thermoanaerobaculia bacterium]|nr:hypothetical protein [Thermoanaerobaculia bacterium]
MSRLTAGGALLLLVLLSLPAAGAEFVAAFSDPSGSFLIDASGAIHAVQPNGSIAKTVVLSQSPGKPLRWARPVRTFARLGPSWFAADGTERLVQFGADGMYSGEVKVPFRIAALTVAGNRLWALNMLAMRSDEQLWFSADGRKFNAYDAPSKQQFDSPLDNLVLLEGNRAGDLFYGSMIGPPLLKRVRPPAKPVAFPLAYSRTKQRTAYENAEGMVDEIAPYSQPARHLMAIEDGSVAVLRNREDILNAAKKLETWIGRRVDRYDASGRHVATGLFPETARFVVAVTKTEAVGISRSGGAISAKWGKPVPGAVWTP